MELVTVNILVTNERRYLKGCIGAVAGQTYPNIELIVMDNGSTDGSTELVKAEFPNVNLVENGENLGCAGGRNKAIRMSSGRYFVTVDPDVFLTPTFIEEKVRVAEKNLRIGMVEGKLLKAEFDGDDWRKTGVLDSTGVTICKNRKNYDRGYGAPEEMYAEEEFVFGASGATPLYRREMLDELKIGNEYFDEDFFIYREEVDLAWRAQLGGWKCFYTPKAIAYHIRTYSPETRTQQPRTLRRLQFRNRYLMMLKNDSWRSILRDAPHILRFEILAFGYVLLREPCLLLGYGDVLKLLSRMMQKRSIVQSRKSVPDAYMLQWFV
jgi:GT2 family glycosyltransferase